MENFGLEKFLERATRNASNNPAAAAGPAVDDLLAAALSMPKVARGGLHYIVEFSKIHYITLHYLTLPYLT